MIVNLVHISKKVELFQRINRIFNQNTLIVPIRGTANTLIFACNLPVTSNFMAQFSKYNFIKIILWDPLWGLMGRFDHLVLNYHSRYNKDLY